MMQPHTLHRNSSRSAKGKGTPSASTPVVKNTTKERAEERANSSTSPSSVTVPSFRNSNCDRPLSVASRWKVVPVSSCAGSSSASLLPPPAQEIPAELCALWGQYGLTMPTAVGYPRPSPILAPAATDTPLRSARTTVGLPVPSRGEGLPACPPTHDLHWNVFFPHGIEQQPPIVLHYLSVGGWRTSAACGDYFTHRRLRHRGDSPGHVARWLFNAHPRNKFVFLIEGVCTPESAAVAEGASLGVVSTREDSHGGDPLGATTGQLDSDHDTTLSSSFDSQPLLPSEDVPSPSMGRLAFAKGFGKGLIGGLRRVRDQVSRLYGSRPAFAMKRPKRRSDGAVTHAAADSVGASSPRRHGKSDASGRGSQHLHEVQGDSPNPNPTNTRDSPNVRLPPSVYSSSVGASPKQGAARVSSMAATSGEAVYKVVEAIEILHEDISALDYTPKLTTSRFTVEAREVHSFIFNSLEDALRYYGSEEAMHQIKAQRSALVSQTVPQHARALSKRHLGKGDSPTEIDQGGEPPRSREQEEMENGGPPAPSRGRSMFFEELPVDPTVDADLSQGSNGEAYASSNGFLHPPRYHATFSDTLVSIYTSDPNFNAVLREVLMPESGLHPYTSSMVAQKRMLALYETGMPSWTMILASTGLPYRRLFRLVYVLIVNVLPVISLLSGCYDLYKHLPQLKRFFARTLEPLTLWIEQRFTLRVSVLSTYLLTVSLTIVTSLQSFLSQFSIINYVLYPFVQLITAIIQLPFVLVFESLRSALLIVLSFVQLAWLSVKVLFVGPFLLISQLAALQGAAAVPVAAVHGTSLTLKWWNAWREFWVTVAAPINNLATAWWNSLMHIVVSASKREASLRRWISPKRELLLSGQIQVWDILEMNARLMFELIVPGWTLTFTMMLLVTYMYWMLLVVPERTKAALLTASQGGTAPSFFGPVTTLVVDDYE